MRINRLGETHRNLDEMGLQQEAQNVVSQVTPITEQTNRLTEGLRELKAAKDAADGLTDAPAIARAYCDTVRPSFDLVRSSIDVLEGLVDDKIWPLPKYRELLFLR